MVRIAQLQAESFHHILTSGPRDPTSERVLAHRLDLVIDACGLPTANSMARGRSGMFCGGRVKTQPDAQSNV